MFDKSDFDTTDSTVLKLPETYEIFDYGTVVVIKKNGIEYTLPSYKPDDTKTNDNNAEIYTTKSRLNLESNGAAGDIDIFIHNCIISSSDGFQAGICVNMNPREKLDILLKQTDHYDEAYWNKLFYLVSLLHDETVVRLNVSKQKVTDKAGVTNAFMTSYWTHLQNKQVDPTFDELEFDVFDDWNLWMKIESIQQPNEPIEPIEDNSELTVNPKNDHYYKIKNGDNIITKNVIVHKHNGIKEYYKRMYTGWSQILYSILYFKSNVDIKIVSPHLQKLLQNTKLGLFDFGLNM